jgi:hypothetical protein
MYLGAGMTKRLAFLAAGAAVIVCEAFSGTTPASAGGVTSTPAECIRLGGTPDQYDKKLKGHWCETRVADQQCERQLGDPLAYWDVRTRRCDKCFLTTACVHYLALADDCFELSSLRRFRDNSLLRMSGGPEDIALYYKHAPQIVQHILASADPSRDFARLYALYILPSAIAAQLGFDRAARRIYTRMMRDLAARYAIDVA